MSDFIGGFSESDGGSGKSFDLSDVLHRLYVVREFSEVVKQKSFQVLSLLLLPVIEEAIMDHEPVIRQAAVEQIPIVTEGFLRMGGEMGYTSVLQSLLPIVAQLTTDRNPQVRMSAIESFQDMAKLIRHEDLEKHLIPFVRSLVNDSTEEDHRVEAANLCHNLSPVLGKELTKQIFLPFVSKLSCDPAFRVRKAIAGNLGNICQTIGVEATTEHILPIFIELSKDEIWSVRKGCAEVLVSVSQNVSPIERYSKLIQVFEQFVVDDSSRWVNSTAFQNLGPFIATFDGSQVTPRLLLYFTEMISPAKNRFPDSDLVTHCAFNFPAVLYTVGSSRWAELSKTYFTLVSDPNWKVRRSLSHSLHEVAKILGPAETRSSLIPTFNLFLQDLDEVKVGVIKHFGEFLECVEPSLRENYIGTLNGLIGDLHKWRFRKLISKQFGKICELYSLKTTITQITPLIIDLLNDPVSKVRNYASSGVGSLINKIQSKQTTSPTSSTPEEDMSESIDMIINKLKSFALEPTYSSRQVLVAAEVLATKIAANEKLASSAIVQSTLAKLKQDNDIDVHNY
eukprot:gene8048-9456_t